ncbi:hypothetical protein [uncultured Nostoc sp.]|uniref:hypothetical protein n=1 Tax=uncultured Nostoc sp. TaxID=340711 RepID=UPI0035CCA791
MCDRILEKLDLTLSDTEGNLKSDRYGHTVAEIFSSKNGVEKNFNEEQLSSGNAFLG